MTYREEEEMAVCEDCGIPYDEDDICEHGICLDCACGDCEREELE